MTLWESWRQWIGPLTGGEGGGDRFGLGPEGRRRLLILGLVAVAGAALLAGGRGVVPPASEPPRAAVAGSALDPDLRFVRELTAELEGILGQIQGAGRVRVMLTLERGFRDQLAMDVTRDESQTEERDAQGGTRLRQERRVTESVRDRVTADGAPRTIAREWPRIAGVVVAAEGGGDPWVRRVLAEAAATVLHLPQYRVQVVPAR
ncbi:hypothetical protein [Limnochorda sp.]|uniref:hypothetical protein n=1 Tax=Limnochorda sp. TaxID=1940279 RepID=UPI0039C4519E